MKNNFLLIIFFIITHFYLILEVKSSEPFNFDVTEVEILENGNVFLGKKRGIATSKENITIEAENFRYNKSSNILEANGDVVINDNLRNLKIFSDKITYFKNDEIILTNENSKAIQEEIIITASNFKYDKKLNILNAKYNVEVIDNLKNIKIFSDEITYFKNDEIIFTKNNSKAIKEEITITADIFNFNKLNNILIAEKNVKIDDSAKDNLIFSQKITYFINEEKFYSENNTQALIENKYNFTSKNVLLDRKMMELSSKEKTLIKDNNSNKYELNEFKYFYDIKLLKGIDVKIITNESKKKSDIFFFKEAFIDFMNDKFISKNTEILLHKNLLDGERNLETNQTSKFIGRNDPRISSVSSSGNQEKTVLNKAIFTSCEKNDDCPPWSIKADTITHDKIKKEIFYKNAILNIYDVPVFYFPKFFHPDPSVKRRSGFLQPRLNNSNILGSSINIPYFNAISHDRDFTFKPTIFDNRIYMFQNEYRHENKNSSFIADFSYTKGYKSSKANNRNSISHLFAKFNLDLGFEDYENSELKIFTEKVNNDTYLKVFENVLITDKTFENDLKDQNNLTSGIELTLDSEKFNFTSGMTIYENLQSLNNDRYQHVFPYYNFSNTLYSNENGSLNFISNGKNRLSNTNNLRSNITNDINYVTNNLYSKNGFVNNFGVYFKNLNVMGKNDAKYKSSLQTELLNIYEVNTSLPLIKLDEFSKNYLTPKISFRINPSDMKNYASDERLITADNIFDINRLAIGDSYESGKSITLGLDYRKENNINSDKYFEAKFATVFRDDEERNIPGSSTINRKTSNLVGSIENNFSDYFKVDYNFSIDNNLKNFEYNSINTEFKVNNFITNFNFIEKNGELGDLNTIENSTSYSIDENNSIFFKTRRNRKISLTEYYDLIYEYQNDCLTAGIKYRKTYYQDRDLKPKEDLFFTVTLFPLTTLDQKIDQSLYSD